MNHQSRVPIIMAAAALIGLLLMYLANRGAVSPRPEPSVADHSRAAAAAAEPRAAAEPGPALERRAADPASQQAWIAAGTDRELVAELLRHPASDFDLCDSVWVRSWPRRRPSICRRSPTSPARSASSTPREGARCQAFARCLAGARLS